METTTYVPRLGDRGTATWGTGTPLTGVVYAIHENSAGDSVWVGTASPPAAAYNLRGFDMVPTRFLSGDRMDSEMVPEGTQGEWFPASCFMPVGTTPATPLPTPEDLLRAQITAMEQDVRTIGEHLKETAQRHEWCGEYEEHLAKLLRSLSGFTEDTLKAAASRQKAYDVTFSYTITVHADSENDAIQEAESRAEFSYGEWNAEEADY